MCQRGARGDGRVVWGGGGMGSDGVWGSLEFGLCVASAGITNVVRRNSQSIIYVYISVKVLFLNRVQNELDKHPST